jgi:hypothetical protein
MTANSRPGQDRLDLAATTGKVGSGAPTETPAVLKDQLRALRAQRLDHEREAAQLEPVLRAIALTRRDRDSGSTAKLRANRAQLERVWSDTEDLIVTGARVAVLVYLRGGDETDPVVRQALRAIAQIQVGQVALAEAVNGGPA